MFNYLNNILSSGLHSPACRRKPLLDHEQQLHSGGSEHFRWFKGQLNQFFTFKSAHMTWAVHQHVWKKSALKPFVAPEEAAYDLINCLQWCCSVALVAMYSLNTLSTSALKDFRFSAVSLKTQVTDRRNGDTNPCFSPPKCSSFITRSQKHKTYIWNYPLWLRVSVLFVWMSIT